MDISERVPALNGPVEGDDYVEVRTSVLAQFLRTESAKSLPRVEKWFGRQFQIDESFLRKLDKRIREHLDDTASQSIALYILVGYSDKSAESFNDLDECFDRAGEEKDAERISLTWARFVPESGFHEVGLEFVTERPFDAQKFRRPIPQEAGILLTVSGATRTWVKGVFRNLEMLLANTKLSLVLRPLEVFSHETFTSVISWLVGALGWFATFRIIGALYSDPARGDALTRILQEQDLAARFEQYMRETYSPSSPFIVGLVVFMLPYFFLFLGQFLGTRFLVYLVPRSGIRIGLSTRRYDDYINAFKFIVFTLLLGSAIAVIVNLFTEML